MTNRNEVDLVKDYFFGLILNRLVPGCWKKGKMVGDGMCFFVGSDSEMNKGELVEEFHKERSVLHRNWFCDARSFLDADGDILVIAKLVEIHLVSPFSHHTLSVIKCLDLPPDTLFKKATNTPLKSHQFSKLRTILASRFEKAV